MRSSVRYDNEWCVDIFYVLKRHFYRRRNPFINSRCYSVMAFSIQAIYPHFNKTQPAWPEFYPIPRHTMIRCATNRAGNDESPTVRCA